MIASNQRTLYPYADGDDDGTFPVASNHPEMRVVTFAEGEGPDHPLPDEWTTAILDDGRTVWVRRADCGAGCRCAGQYTLQRTQTQFMASLAPDNHVRVSVFTRTLPTGKWTKTDELPMAPHEEGVFKEVFQDLLDSEDEL